MKKLVVWCLAFLLVLGNASSVFAADEAGIMDIGDHKIYYTKENVSYSKKYGNFYQVSSYLTGYKGDSITVSKEIEIHASVSGSVVGINVIGGGYVSSSIGYTLHLQKQGTYYVGFRAYYLVETGTRVARTASGKVLSRNSYKVMNPINGEYRLIRK